LSVIEVTVKFFGSYQEEVGEEEVQVRLGDGETVADLLETLRNRMPRWAAYEHEPMVARNLEYVAHAEGLDDGDEIALFPPVSGG
jgi:molybdopterin synthase sulfur carrier subunit